MWCSREGMGSTLFFHRFFVLGKAYASAPRRSGTASLATWSHHDLMSYRILGALTRERAQEMRSADATDPLALTPQQKTLRAVRARLTGEVEPQYPDPGTASDARLKPLRSPWRHLDLISVLSDGWGLHRYSTPHRRTCTCAQASR
jgi:hypothetical protein